MKDEGMKRDIFTRVFAFTLLAAMLSGLFMHFQLYRYEQGILDIAAAQQDGYVQLVLDQINLKDNRDDEEIIQDILGTLDASSNRYWTFSRSQSMLFVKDILETNRYKGISSDSFYASESAKEFIDGLKLNRVSHSAIKLDGKEYIASGVAFEYNKSSYRLCLLTNRTVLLDNNVFLKAKTELEIALLFILILFIMLPAYLSIKLRDARRKNDEQAIYTDKLNKSLMKMNKLLADRDLHDTRTNSWRKDAAPDFLKKLWARNASPLYLAKLCPESREERDAFLSRAELTLDKRVLRFEDDDCGLILVFVGIDENNALLSLEPLLSETVFLQKSMAVESTENTELEEILAYFGLDR